MTEIAELQLVTQEIKDAIKALEILAELALEEDSTDDEKKSVRRQLNDHLMGNVVLRTLLVARPESSINKVLSEA